MWHAIFNTHRTDAFTSGNHKGLIPHPLPSRPPMLPALAIARYPSDLQWQQGGGEYRDAKKGERDMLYLYRLSKDSSTSGNHQDHT